MKNKMNIVVLRYKVALFTMMLLVGGFSAFGQEKQINLKDKRITIKMEKQPLGLVFRYLMENYDIPIGFEESLLDKDHNEYFFDTNLPSVGEANFQSTNGIAELKFRVETKFTAELHPITVKFDNGKLEEVFDKIVGQMEHYKWEINDNVINIFPTQGRVEKFQKMMEVKIADFKFEKGKTVNDITINIKKLPEFIKFVQENNLVFFGYRPGGAIRVKAQYGRTVDAEMNFSNLTFRELLNKITKVKKGGWMVRWGRTKPSGRELIDIDI
jgi:hypothetical protein